MLENLIFQSAASKPEPVPTTPGEIYEGGYYAGRIRVADNVYALIISPKAYNNATALAWGVDSNAISGASSTNDGWSNTQTLMALGAANFPAAKFCHDLVIDGYDDWYLPSIDELNILYRNFKPSTSLNNTLKTGGPHGVGHGYNPNSVPIGEAYTSTVPGQTTLTEFQTDGSESLISSGLTTLWSSSENSTNGLYSWRINLNYGSMATGNVKTSGALVRAVRRVLITE